MSKLLDNVIEAALSCRDIMISPFTVSEKDGISNIVTTADNAVEAHLKKQLLDLIPNAAFLGEESNFENGSEYCFVVDPIDGTTNFSRAIKASCVSIGLLKNGKGHLGVVYNPFTDELYYAETGCGAFLNGEKIYVSDRDFEHSIYYTALSLYRKDYAESCLNILRNVYARCNDFRREGSAALEICRLASGKAELYFEIRIFPWDCCAAEVILSEAGGVSKHLYSDERALSLPFPIIAANSEKNLKKLYEIVNAEFDSLPNNYD